MMKIVHTADWHIGNFKGPVINGKNMRLEDTKRCIEALIERVEQEEPDAVLISGDIFNTSSAYETTGMPEVDVAYDYITMLSMVCPVVVMRGTPNHDGNERFEHLENILNKNQDVHVVSEPKVIGLRAAGGEQIYIAAVPGFDRGAYRAKYPGTAKEEENAIFTQELSNIVLGLKSICPPDGITVLMSHYTVPGCNMESGQISFYNQSEPVLLQETLRAAEFDLVALGHIHRPQLVEGMDNVFYSGAVNTLTFNDEGQERGFYIHYFDGEGKPWLTDSEFIALPYRRMHTIRLNDTDIKNLNTGERDIVSAMRWEGKIADKMVRVFYECTQDNNKAFNKAALEKELISAGAYWVSGIDMQNQVEAVNRKELEEQTDPYANLQQYLIDKGYAGHMITNILNASVPIIDKAVSNSTSVRVRGIMIPRSISVKNYRNYREESFDFCDITFCTINGENGAGKSSLFMDAIVDCLYEETREGELTGWISNHSDAKNGSIEFTFSIGEKTFRVVRTRTKSGRATLNLSELVESEWENRSAEKAKETQGKILEVLGMDSRTFRSCVLIMQDQYGIFMETAKEERLKVLGDILGLDIYTYMEADAKDILRRLKGNLSENKTILDIHYSELREIGNPKSLLEVEKECKSRSEDKLNQIQPKRDEKAAELKQQQEYASFLKEMKEEIDSIMKKICAEEEEQKRLKTIQADCLKQLGEENSINEKVSLYQELQERVQILALSVKEYELKNESCKSFINQKEAVEQELKTVLTGIEQIQEKINQYSAAPINDLGDKIDQYKVKQAEYEALNARREEFRILEDKVKQNVAMLRQEETKYQYEIGLLENIVAGYDDQVEKMKDSGCVDIVNASCKFLAGAKDAEYRRNQELSKLSALRSEQKSTMEHLQTVCTESEKELSEFDYSQEAFEKSAAEMKEYGRYLEEYEKSQKAAADCKVLKEKLSSMCSVRDSKMQALTKIEEDIRRVQDELIRLKADYETSGDIKNQMENLIPYLTMREQIPVYRERLSNTKCSLESSEATLKTLIEEHEGKRISVEQLESKCVGMDNIMQELQDIDACISEQQRIMQEHQKTIGSLEEKMKKQESIENMVRQLEETNVDLGEKISIYETLRNAFSKEGIPHNIIRSIIPHLTSAANNILGQMTGGKLGMDFVMDKTLKSGKDAVALDILIEEYGKGTLPYLSKSGGEKVKASLAAALALAEIKSTSLGIQSGMLFIDEPPFLDSEGIQAYVDSLEVLQERYADVKIMAITHDPTMKARFPQSIDVIKSETGSRIVRE